MTTDMSAPATKRDLVLLKKALQKNLASKKELALTNKALASTNNALASTNKELASTNKNLGSLRQDLARTDRHLSDFHSEFLDFKNESIKRFNRIDERIYGLEIRMDEWRDELRSDMQTMTENIKFYFDVAVENFRKDMRDFKNDDIENVKHRVTRLEIHTGIRPA